MWLTNHFPELRVSLCELSRFQVDCLTTFDQDDFFYKADAQLGVSDLDENDETPTWFVDSVSFVMFRPYRYSFPQLFNSFRSSWLSIGSIHWVPLWGRISAGSRSVWLFWDHWLWSSANMICIWSYFLYPQCRTCWFMLILRDILLQTELRIWEGVGERET